MLTIEQIREMTFYGKYYLVRADFDKINEFAANDANPISHRAEALRHLYKAGMGLENEEAGDDLDDMELVEEFMEENGGA